MFVGFIDGFFPVVIYSAFIWSLFYIVCVRPKKRQRRRFEKWAKKQHEKEMREMFELLESVDAKIKAKNTTGDNIK